jgi:chaperone modulatory protein CbpM
MQEEDILIGMLLDDACLTLEELACAGAVSPEWILRHVEEGFLTAAGAGISEWRFSSRVLQRVRRMHALERDFDAAPELAALVADLLEEMDELRARRWD